MISEGLSPQLAKLCAVSYSSHFQSL